MKKRVLGMVMASMLLMSAFVGCGSEYGDSSETKAPGTTSKTESGSDFDLSAEISVISREDGSGTRGAFTELLGIEEEDESGEKVDRTITTATVTNNTSVMMTTVAGDKAAIGYISLGSLDESVKALSIDGTEATVENIKAGTYKISRPFNIATTGQESDAAKDFISFIMSADGQAVIEENGYISVSEQGSFTSSGAEGKVVVAGSSSVSPVMEKLIEAYKKANDKVEVELQTSDSTTGMTSAVDGVCDIGMASRELKDSETQKGLVSKTIAMDGIAVIVNNENPTDDMTSEQVKNIYIGDAITWEDATK